MLKVITIKSAPNRKRFLLTMLSSSLASRLTQLDADFLSDAIQNLAEATEVDAV